MPTGRAAQPDAAGGLGAQLPAAAVGSDLRLAVAAVVTAHRRRGGPPCQRFPGIWSQAPGLVRSADVEIVPNPIDPADLLVARAVEDTGQVNVAYLGAPRQYKGFQFLPDVVEAVGSELPVHWLVFSRPTDDDLAETWARLRELASGGTVSIEGKFTDVREAYARCDIVVCPSLWDSFCRVAAEAMLNGIPVVGSDLEPIRDLLGDDEAGLVFTRGDVAECAKAVTRLVSDPDLRARLGAAGRKRAAAYAPDTVRRQMLALYGVPARRG